MMLKRFFVPLLLAVSFLVSGCTSPYAPAPQILPQHIRKIFIRPIMNATTQYGLEEKLMLKVVDEFVRDGRLNVVNSENEADGVLVCEISRYILQPLQFDANNVAEQFKLWVLLNVSLVDRANNVTLWSEDNLEGVQIFFDSTKPGGRTEEEVREALWEDLARDIAKRTVQGFGSVSGVSEKKLPTK